MPPLPRYKVQPHFLRITPERARRWAPSAIVFGVAAGIFVSEIAEAVPIFRRDVLKRTPVLGEYWRRKDEAKTA